MVGLTHENMNGEVKGDGHPGDRSTAVELCVTQDGSGRVVKDVKELQRLLLKHEENRVCKLPVPFLGSLLARAMREPKSERRPPLEIVVCNVQRLDRGRPALIVADSVVETMVIELGDDLQRNLSFVMRMFIRRSWVQGVRLPS
jgi:hypothetical protein